MSDALDVFGSLVDLFWELGQQRAIAAQANKTASVDERVQNLERQLDTTHRLLSELMSRLGKILGDPQFQNAATAFWRVEKGQPCGAVQEARVQHKQALKASANEALCCLACGQAMGEDESKCSKCGWTYAGKDGA